eukprot:4993923-Prymnesium_polylepis.1
MKGMVASREGRSVLGDGNAHIEVQVSRRQLTVPPSAKKGSFPVTAVSLTPRHKICSSLLAVRFSDRLLCIDIDIDFGALYESSDLSLPRPSLVSHVA